CAGGVGCRRFVGAEALSDALVSRGATGEAIVTYGFGADEPAAANTTRAGRSANRRAEFYFVPGPAMLSAAKSGKL
ncbi:MAG: hypothetical protein K2M97_04545, partial [Muribaculaceae bacterium]|nr:hypothetical protein [Muribaculaceae bacterium]